MNRALRASASTVALTATCSVVVMLGTFGCATPPQDHPGYLERASSQMLDGVRVSAAALSDEESAAVYGVPLAKQKIQPVWVEVENETPNEYWLLFPGLDPNFFPASEAAESMASAGPKVAELKQRFQRLAFANPVPPGHTASGFVLTNRQEGVKLLQIDLFADEQSRSVSFLAAVPGLRIDYQQKVEQHRKSVATQSVVDYTEAAKFRAALQALPCCATNEDASRNGDPLNLVIVGDSNDVMPALVRRGWTVTETTWRGSVLRMMNSALAGEPYANAPVSSLYLYGRPQDVALQKARDNIHQRNHLRLWRSPMHYQGKPVWVGQISRDIGSRMTLHTSTFTTHKIDPDVDEAARALLEDVVYSEGLEAWGRVAGVGAAPKSAPRKNLTTDPYYTSGLRLVLLFDKRPRSLTDIEFLRWEGGNEFIDQPATGSTP